MDRLGRSKRMVNLALQGIATPSTSTRERRYSIVKILQLGHLVIVPADSVRFTNTQDLHMTTYNNQEYWCIIFNSGELPEMQRWLEVLNQFHTLEGQFKYLGNCSRKTQTDTSEIKEAETQTADILSMDTPAAPHAGETEMVESSLPLQNVYHTLWGEEPELSNVSEHTVQETSEVYVPPSTSEVCGTSQDENAMSCFVQKPWLMTSSVGELASHPYEQDGSDPDDPGFPQDVELQHTNSGLDEVHGTLEMKDPIPEDGSDPDDPGLPQDVELQDTNRGLDEVHGTLEMQDPAPEGTQRRKRHFCIYCQNTFVNLGRHLFAKHKNEDRVSKIMNLPDQDTHKLKELSQFRREGNAKLNEERVKEGKTLIPFNKGVKSQVCPCPNCGAVFSKTTLYRHYKLCTGKTVTPRLLSTISHGKVRLGKTPTHMCDALKDVIIPPMHAGEVVNEITEDPDIVFFGNSQCLRYRTDLDRQKNTIRGRLRAVSKLKIEMKKKDPNIVRLRDIFETTKWDTFIHGVSVCANLHEEGRKQSPNNIANLGQLMANIAMDIKVTTPRDIEGEKIRKNIECWIELFKRMYSSTIGRVATQLSEKMKFENRTFGPLASDIVKLTKHIKQQIQAALSRLEQGFSYSSWEKLNKYCMLELLMFNRKRKAEVQYLTLEDYQRKEKVKKDTDVFKSLTKTEQMISQRYYHVMVRGKLARGVPLLIEERLAAAIDMIVKLRIKAGVSETNPYLFAKKEKGHFLAYDAHIDAVYAIEAEAPTLLNSRRLRSHVACVAQALDLTEADLRSLSSFLGHTTQTHLEHYRMPNDALNTARISRVLVALDQGNISKYKGKRIEEIDIDVPLTEIMEDDDGETHGTEVKKRKISSTVSSPPPKKRHTEESTPTKRVPTTQHLTPTKKGRTNTKLHVSPSPKQRVRWTTPEKEAMKEAFGHHLECGTTEKGLDTESPRGAFTA